VLMVFESRMVRKILGPTMDEITGYWRRLLTKQLNDFCSSPNIIEVKSEMGWICVRHGAEVHTGIWWGGKGEGKRLLGRPRCRWEDNIRLDVLEIGRCRGMD